MADEQQLSLFGDDENPDQLPLFGDEDDDELQFTDGDAEPEEEPSAAPSALTLIPTSTTDPSRPRTLAAGWNSRTKTLTVLFRDGTLWNYYEVDPTLWALFARAVSKGAFIYTYLDPRGSQLYGPANGDSATAEAVYDYASIRQHQLGGVQTSFGQSATSRRRLRAVKHVQAKKAGRPTPFPDLATALGYRSGNLGGTGRTRQQKTILDEAARSFYRNRRV